MSLKGEQALALAIAYADEVTQGGGAAKSKKFELIEEIIVDGNNVTLIERNVDKNGVPYSFEEVYIRFEMEPTSSTGNANFVSWANNEISCGIGSLIASSKKLSSILSPSL